MLKNPYTFNYAALYRGIVEDNIDPENLGRCKVRVPSIHGELTYPIDILPWARPLVLSPIKAGRGSVNLPDIGDIVWIFFEGADKEFPIYLGGTYAIGDVPISNDIVEFYIEGNDKISYHRKKRVYTIDIEGIRVIVTPEKIHMDLKNGTQIIATPENIDIDAPGTINVTAGESINMKAPIINLN